MMSNQRGFSLMEALIATALLLIVIFSTTSYLAQTNSDSKTQNIRDQQRVIYNKLALVAQDPESIGKSGDSLGPFGICMKLDDGAPCTISDVTNQQPFVLMAPDGSALTSPSVLYSVDGNTDCGLSDPSKLPCRFNPQATFWATCGLDPVSFLPQTSCLEPVAINIRIQVKSIGGTPMTGAIANYPNDAWFNDATKPESYTFTTLMRDIKLAYNNPCPNVQVLAFDKATGKLSCRCPNGKKPDLITGACEAITCNAGEIMIGMKDNGMPECALPTNNQLCWTLPDLKKNGDCGTGAWLVSVDYGKCRSAPVAKGKGGGDEVTCERDSGRCCMGTQ